MKIRWTWILIFCFSLMPLGAAQSYSAQLADLQKQLSLNPTNKELLFKVGELCHDEGVHDNKKAVVLAEKYFLQLLAIDTNHARGRALYGSTLTMKARDTFWPPSRLSYVKSGIKEMDAAVKLAPLDPIVRFSRSVNNFHMPKWLEREEIVKTDLAWLWEQIEKKTDALPVDTKQEVARLHGLVLKKEKKDEQAREIWKKGLSMDPASEVAKDIQKELDRVSPKAK